MEHICQCRECKPSAYPQGERMNKNHYAVRFGDRGGFKVLFDGADVTNDATECVMGDEGHVWILGRVNPDDLYLAHPCTCDGGVCEIERMGKVEVKSIKYEYSISAL